MMVLSRPGDACMPLLVSGTEVCSTLTARVITLQLAERKGEAAASSSITAASSSLTPGTLARPRGCDATAALCPGHQETHTTGPGALLLQMLTQVKKLALNQSRMACASAS